MQARRTMLALSAMVAFWLPTSFGWSQSSQFGRPPTYPTSPSTLNAPYQNPSYENLPNGFLPNSGGIPIPAAEPIANGTTPSPPPPNPALSVPWEMPRNPDDVTILETRLLLLEAELAKAQQQPPPANPVDLPPPATTNAHIVPYYYQEPGFMVGAELAFLKPQGSMYASTVPGIPNGPVGSYFDVELSPRFWIGYETGESAACQATYWDIESDSMNPFTGAVSSVDARTIDYENVFTETMLRTQFRWRVGARYAKFRDTRWFPGDSMLRHEYEGAGATLGISAQRPFGSLGAALVGGMRTSFLFGENSLDVLAMPGAVTSASRDQGSFTQIVEANVGIEWGRDLMSGSRIFVRGMFENQSWRFPTVHPQIIPGDAGFIGGTLAFGIDR